MSDAVIPNILFNSFMLQSGLRGTIAGGGGGGGGWALLGCTYKIGIEMLIKCISYFRDCFEIF